MPETRAASRLEEIWVDIEYLWRRSVETNKRLMINVTLTRFAKHNQCSILNPEKIRRGQAPAGKEPGFVRTEVSARRRSQRAIPRTASMESAAAALIQTPSESDFGS